MRSTAAQNTGNEGAFNYAKGDRLIGVESIVGGQIGDTLTGNSSANTIWGEDGAADTLSGGSGTDEFYFVTANFGNDVIKDYNLTSREKIYLCQGSGAPPTLATHCGDAADNGSDYVITVTHAGAMAGMITLTGITSSSTNFDRRRRQRYLRSGGGAIELG